MLKNCEGIAPADIGSPCDANAASMSGVVDCLLADHETRVEQMIRATYASACNLLAAVNLDNGFPAVCTAP